MQTSFETTVDKLLDNLFDALLEQCEQQCEDIELDKGVLTITVSKTQTFVISKHAPSQQIWLSSPLSGAWHFQATPPQEHLPPLRHSWVSTKNSDCFFPQLLEQELSSLLTLPVRLSDVS